MIRFALACLLVAPLAARADDACFGPAVARAQAATEKDVDEVCATDTLRTLASGDVLVVLDCTYDQGLGERLHQYVVGVTRAGAQCTATSATEQDYVDDGDDERPGHGCRSKEPVNPSWGGEPGLGSICN